MFIWLVYITHFLVQASVDSDRDQMDRLYKKMLDIEHFVKILHTKTIDLALFQSLDTLPLESPGHFLLAAWAKLVKGMPVSYPVLYCMVRTSCVIFNTALQ